MTELSGVLEFSSSPIKDNEAHERRIREGLSKKDGSLPIGQNIVRIYGRTPELHWLGEATATGDDTEITQAIERTTRSIKTYYSLELVYRSDRDMLRMTKNPDNKTTLRGRKIFMSESMRPFPEEVADELIHEIGAARLISIYGSKEGIPYGLPSLYGSSEDDNSATHYLDAFAVSLGKEQDIIDQARQFVGQNGLAVRK